MHETVFKEIQERDGKDFEISVWYSKGGMNYVNSKEGQRGYYFSFIPVTVVNHGNYQTVKKEAYTGFTGRLLEVNRKSKKKENEAIELAERKIEELIDLI